MRNMSVRDEEASLSNFRARVGCPCFLKKGNVASYAFRSEGDVRDVMGAMWVYPLCPHTNKYWCPRTEGTGYWPVRSALAHSVRCVMTQTAQGGGEETFLREGPR